MFCYSITHEHKDYRKLHSRGCRKGWLGSISSICCHFLLLLVVLLCGLFGTTFLFSSLTCSLAHLILHNGQISKTSSHWWHNTKNLSFGNKKQHDWDYRKKRGKQWILSTSKIACFIAQRTHVSNFGAFKISLHNRVRIMENNFEMAQP